MKKKLCAILAVVFVFMSTFSAYAENISEQITIILPENKKEISAKNIENIVIKSQNNLSEENMFDIVLAIVNYNGRVINYVSSKEILGENEIAQINAYTKILPEGYKLKIFAWDNLKNKNIISNIIDIPILNGYIEKSIVSISELNETIPQWSEYILPNYVPAMMNSGEIEKLPVKWNENKIDTAKSGKYVVEGHIDGYNEENVILNLNISSVQKIMSVDDINITIGQNDYFKLPSTVTAKMSTGDDKQFFVKWNVNNVDTSKVGIQNFEGTVKSFEGTVKLTLTVEMSSLEDTVVFKNSEIEEIIKSDLGKDKITKRDLSNVTELNFAYGFSNANYSLEDLKYFRNLKDLDLSFAEYTYDLSPLSNLINIEKLNLYGNKISDVSPLENLINLKELNLSTNSIKDIKAIRNLTNLKILKLNSNNIKDYTPTAKYYENLTEKDFETSFLVADENNVINCKLNVGEKLNLPYGVKLSNGNVTFVDWEKDEIKAVKSEAIKVNGESLDSDSNIVLECTVVEDEEADKVITFADENLEKAVRKAIDKYKGDIYYSDVKNLKTLDAVANGIEDLSGIENLKGLEKLGLWANKVGNSQLIRLKGLTNLKQLDLALNNLTYIPDGIFENMSNLEELVLDENKITEIHLDAFVGLDNLKGLLIEETYITNVDFVKPLKNLETLFVRDNRISNIESIKGLTNLRELWIENNNISSISALSDMSLLNWVNLGGNQIKDISCLENCKKIARLNIENNNISDITVVSNMASLEWLEAKNNRIFDLSGVSELVGLNILDLANNEITNIEPLRKLVNLTQLYLKGNKITDFSPVEDFYYNIKRTDFELN